MIKRLCRKLGMPRWPFRQIDSINKAMEDLHDQLEGARSEADRTRCVVFDFQKHEVRFSVYYFTLICEVRILYVRVSHA